MRLNEPIDPMDERIPPVVLTFSGHDPSGGAGIQADIESINSMGCHPASLITCLTLQDTANVYRLIPVDSMFIREQAELLFDDYSVAAIKVGLIGTPNTARLIAELIEKHASCPVVLDTVLAAGGGSRLAGIELLDVIRSELVPLATLLTPNSQEARRLGEAEDLNQCAANLLARGAGSVLITGTHEADEQVLNRLYQSTAPPVISSWKRLPGSYHGSGCTLASSIAACMANGQTLPDAVDQGLAFTWSTLERGYRPGRGQLIPRRSLPAGYSGIRASRQ